MQKVEGSNPFSRFERVFICGASSFPMVRWYFVPQIRGTSAIGRGELRTPPAALGVSSVLTLAAHAAAAIAMWSSATASAARDPVPIAAATERSRSVAASPAA